jgi:threonylcarbamoyladenosine tRNA methylthiotransferase MtaB
MAIERVFVKSFGCRASQGDGDGIANSFEARGLEIVRDAERADLIVLNTCTVTSSADAEVRHLIRHYHRAHPQARILVTGCYAQRDPEGLASLEGVDWVAGNSHKNQIAQLITLPTSADYHGRVFVGELPTTFSAAEITDIREDRTRPNLKVQDGCSNRCSFCVIPSVRGRSRSAPLANVIAEVRRLATRYIEIVLTGINLGRWGRDLDARLRFIDLVCALLAETPVRRLRLSSVEPMDWSDELLELMAAQPRLARHVHAPLQSGSDRILKRMFRKYRVRHYEPRIRLARCLMPDAAVGADVLVGFPGETDQEFAETVAFIRAQPFTYLHVFTYSERPGTVATGSPEVVPMEVRRERNRVLRELSDSKNREFRQSMAGRTLSAVTLEQRGLALTTNYLRVQLAQEREPNQLIDVRIGDAGGPCLAEAPARQTDAKARIVGQ